MTSFCLLVLQAGCFFKLQKDVRGLYGGEKYAMKATSAELRGMKVLGTMTNSQ